MGIVSYIIPILLALILHGGLLLLLIPHWFQQDDPYKKRQPRHIQAEMIDLKALMNQETLQKEFAAEQAKKDAAEKKRLQEEKQRQEQKQKEAEKARIAEAEKKAQQEKARQEAQKQKTIEEARKKAEKKLAEQKILEEARLKIAAEKALAEKKKQEEQKKRELAKQQAEEKKRAQEKKIEAEKKRVAEAKRLEAEKAKQAQAKREAAEKAAAEKLAKEQAAEQRRLAAAERSEKIRGDITAYIQGLIQRNWRIPSTARNGMSAKVEVRLFPSGEVDSVRVLKSSGDSAFDKSAEQAVYRAEKFPRVAEIDPIFFERELRKVIIEFRPEGLRW